MEKVWGYHLVIDLKDCNPDTIRSGYLIKKYVEDICLLIEMTRYGDTVLERFGKDPEVTGYSMFQLIEESNISGHFVEKNDTAFIDIFSCKEYKINTAVQYTAKYFGAKEVFHTFIKRGEKF